MGFYGFSARDRERNRVERLINRLKQFRPITTRYEKQANNYLAIYCKYQSLQRFRSPCSTLGLLFR
ncbi:MAG TPA: hypothetical protein DCP31_32530 [Cyanobacteria bacterium UBA8543]|nr:hypothetical protein [Cyanobacteria bacterium UBA8543]